ncbi:hypothetical protein HYQ45_019014 [Verticillium longisporum]|uniref:Uncharacterized protein n=1 Tax=Verticillium longisporum TaxID=100787 RepID=A0A8I3AH98_VERLO|nr:hypothetical protein HYQ45_019014 [Verticillium longisporum]
MEGKSEAEVEEESEESEEETTATRFDPRRPLYNCGIVIADKSPYLTQAQLVEKVALLVACESGRPYLED